MTLPLILQAAAASAAFSIGVFALSRRERSLASVSLGSGMLLLAVEAAFRIAATLEASIDPHAHWLGWGLAATAFLPGAWVLFGLTYARAWDTVRGIGRAGLVACAIPPFVALIWRLDLLRIVEAPNVSNAWLVQLGWPGQTVQTAVLIASVAVLVNLERTFRAAVGTMRWRIKFLLFGIGLIFLVRIYTSSQALIFRSSGPTLASLDALAVVLAAPLVVRSMLRPGSFDVAIFPSPAIIKGSLTIFLVGAYLVVVGLLAKVASMLGGDAAFPIKALLVLVAIVGLALVLQSDRARLALASFTARNFRRPLHDAQAVWRRFSAATGSLESEEAIGRSSVHLVSDVFRSLSVTLWLIDANRTALRAVASTALNARHVRTLALSQAPVDSLIVHLSSAAQPTDIDRDGVPWAAALRDANLNQFPNGGNRLVVPILDRGECLGCLVLGDRVAGVPFSVQDLDLLESIARHMAATVLNIRLSERLGVARQFEGFQAMATFFVHDLKNAASSLKLVLANLPGYWDDPAFRTDASRAVAKTVERIEALTARLGALRSGLALQTVAADLDTVVRHAIASVHLPAGITLQADLRATSPAMIDPAQIGKVVTNLLLNAAEAISPPGQIVVTSSSTPETATLTVTDTGCGMSGDFIRDSLFKPFKTTKKSGMGIGLFQSRMIVEAHGGSLTAESTPGQGSTFHVRVPAAGRGQVTGDPAHTATPPDSASKAAPLNGEGVWHPAHPA